MILREVIKVGKQRTEFFKTWIIVLAILMIISSIMIVALSIDGLISSGPLSDSDIGILINIILGLIIANILIIIVLYFFWSILKTLEEIRDRNNNKKEEL